jgi:Ca2+-binding RTX toxin-like protein
MAVLSSVFAITPAQLQQFLGLFAPLMTEGSATEASPWTFKFNDGPLVEGSGFTYNGDKPTGGAVEAISLFSVLRLEFDAIPLATFVQLAATPAQLIAQIFTGDDFIFGSSQNDRLNGFGGDDNFVGAGGVDVIDGGAGTDTASYNGTVVPVHITLNGSAFARVRLGGAAEDLIRNVENVTGGSGADVLRGDGLGNQLIGNGGNDTLRGAGGIDFLDGSGGIDTVDCSDKTAALRITLGDALVGTVKVGGVTEETLAEIENVFGGRGRDAITGSQVRNVLSGNAGDDTINGVAGNDLLVGGLGRDSLTGGLGRDLFDFNAVTESRRGALHDTVNFRRTEGDKIDLSTIDADIDGTAGNQAFRFIGASAFTGLDGQLRFSGGLLQGDVNGDRVADIEIRIVGALTGADVIL